MTKKITIGSAVFDDFEGVYFTYQSLRLNNPEILEEIDFVVIDNNANSAEGKATKSFCEKARIRYFDIASPRSTAIRDQVFRKALAPYVLCIDPHVLLEPQTITKLIEFAEKEESKQSLDFIHGPMLYDYLDPENTPATHMEPKWRENMFGIWGHSEKGKYADQEPFEIEMHGLGLFACRKDAWPGFSPLFKGFGGEEGYIHEKVKQAGGKIWCLPWLRWIHRFDRPRGNVYPLHIQERIRNYAFGWLEVGKDLQEVVEHFKEPHKGIAVELICEDARQLFEEYQSEPEKVLQKIHGPEKAEVAEVEQEESANRKAQVAKQTWHQTEVSLGQEIEFEVLGKQFKIKRFGLEWSTD